MKYRYQYKLKITNEKKTDVESESLHKQKRDFNFETVQLQ